MFGWQAPWPFQWGGSPTPIEQALGALRAGVGTGHMAERDGVDWRWREARAIGLAICMTMDERALMQFTPQSATSGVAFYADLFQLFGFTDQEVRDRATLLMNENGDAGTPQLLAKLQAISPSFSIIEVPWENGSTTVHGSDFESTALPFHLTRPETLYPNFSSEFVVTVVYDAGGVPPTSRAASEEIATAKALLDESLPAWVDYAIGGTSSGFILDASFLDWDRFNP